MAHRRCAPPITSQSGVATIYDIYFDDPLPHANPHCPINVQRQLLTLGTRSDSENGENSSLNSSASTEESDGRRSSVDEHEEKLNVASECEELLDPLAILPTASAALQCDTCDQLRAKYDWDLPSFWLRSPDCKHDHGLLPVSTELVMLYCAIWAFRNLHDKLRAALDTMGQLAEDVAEVMGDHALSDQMQRVEGLVREFAVLSGAPHRTSESS